MNILFVTREYPPFEVGGIGVHTFKLVEHLTKIGVNCNVVSFGDERFSTEKVQFVNPNSSIIDKLGGSLPSNMRIPGFDEKETSNKKYGKLGEENNENENENENGIKRC